MPGGYGNPGGGGDDNFADADAGPKPESEAKRSESEGVTAVLPKTILAGKEFKVGEEVVLKIVADHGDQIEVAYSYGDEGGKGGEGEEAPGEYEAPPRDEVGDMMG